MLFTGEIIGFLGSDAKETSKGISFNVATKNRTTTGEERTVWVCCFINYQTKIKEHLTTGKEVYVRGNLNIDLFKKDNGEYIPSVSMIVKEIHLNGKLEKTEG